MREGVIREKNEYLKVKVDEFITFLSHEGVKSVNSVPLKDVWKMHEDIEDIYFELKDKSDEINDRKQGEANAYANKLLNETDLTERAMRIFEKPIFEEEFKTRNETEIADLKKYLIEKHANDVELKNSLRVSKDSKDLFFNNAMEERKLDLIKNTEKFVLDKTDEIKSTILEAAKKKLRTEINKKLMEENRQRHIERLANNNAREATGIDSDDVIFTRRGFGSERPQIESTSDSKFGGAKKTYSKPSGPREDDDDSGFNRKAFAASKADERPKEQSRAGGPPVFSGKPTFTSNKTKGSDIEFKKNDSKVSTTSNAKTDEKKEAPAMKSSKPKAKKKFDDGGMGRFQDGW